MENSNKEKTITKKIVGKINRFLQLARNPSKKTVLINFAILTTIILAVSFSTSDYSTFFSNLGEVFSNKLAQIWYWYILAVIIYGSVFFVRAYRWKVISEISSGHNVVEKRLSTFSLTRLILESWALNGITFLRLGDVYRIIKTQEAAGSSVFTHGGILVKERVFDLIVVLLVTSVGLFVFLINSTAFSEEEYILHLILLSISLAVIVGFAIFWIIGKYFYNYIPLILKGVYLKFYTGLGGRYTYKSIFQIIFLSGFAWLIEAVRLWIIAYSFGVTLESYEVLLGALISALLTNLPIPGGLIVTELGLRGYLIIIGVAPDAASQITIVDRSITWFLVVIFGLLSIGSTLSYKLVTRHRNPSSN